MSNVEWKAPCGHWNLVEKAVKAGHCLTCGGPHGIPDWFWRGRTP